VLDFANNNMIRPVVRNVAQGAENMAYGMTGNPVTGEGPSAWNTVKGTGQMLGGFLEGTVNATGVGMLGRGALLTARGAMLPAMRAGLTKMVPGGVWGNTKGIAGGITKGLIGGSAIANPLMQGNPYEHYAPGASGDRAVDQSARQRLDALHAKYIAAQTAAGATPGAGGGAGSSGYVNHPGVVSSLAANSYYHPEMYAPDSLSQAAAYTMPDPNSMVGAAAKFVLPYIAGGARENPETAGSTGGFDSAYPIRNVADYYYARATGDPGIDAYGGQDR
jgi:hypothetical protein